MHKNHLNVLLYVLVIISTCGCGKKDEVLARIRGVTITASDFERQMNFSPAQYEGYLNTMLGKQKYLEVLVNEKIIVQAALQEGLDANPAIRQELKAFQAEYDRKLHEYRDKLLIGEFLQSHRNKALRVTDEEIETYYKEHEKDFANPSRVTVRHILCDSEEEARIALARLKKGERFESVVKELSRDSATRDDGGELPPFTQISVIPQFKETVFSMKVNGLSEIIQTEYGYHILKKISEERLAPIERKEADEQIRKILEKEKFMNIIAQYRKDFKVTINTDYFRQKEKGSSAKD